MSIIIRLQRLPWSASAADVREFFKGLIIPEGGVHIVGGREGDAFIAFSSDEDARLAMRHDGKRLKEAKIKLLLSSRQEMQKVIEKARNDYASSLNDPTTDDNGSHRKRRSRSGSRERDGRRSRSRSTERSRDKDSFPSTPQKPSVPISGFSSFPSSMKQTGSFDHGIVPLSESSFGLLDRVPQPPPFKVVAGMLDRNVVEQQMRSQPKINYDMMTADRKNQNFQHSPDSMSNMSSQKSYPQMTMLNEVAFSGQNIDFDGRGSNFQKEKFLSGQFTNNNPQMQQPGQFPISANLSHPPPPLAATQQQGPVRNRRCLLPEPDEIQPMITVPEVSFLRNRPDEIMFKPMLDRPPANLISFRNVPDMQPTMFPQDFYPNSRELEPFYRAQPPVESFEPSYSDVPSFSRLDRHAEFGCAICIDNAPLQMIRYGEVRLFFHPMRLDGPDSIKIITDEDGVKTGRIYCRFSTTTDTEAALHLDHLNGVRIRPCSDEEFDSVVDGGRSDFNKRPAPWKDRGDSNSSWRDRETDSSWREQRDVDASWRERSDADASWKERDNNNSSDRFRSSYRERNQRSMNQPWDVIDGRYIVEITNLPYKSGDDLVWDLIYDLKPVSFWRKMKQQNHITLQSDTAFIEFNNEADADASLALSGRTVGGRPVNFRKSSVEILEQNEIRLYNPKGRRSPPPYSRDYRGGDRGDRDRNQRDRDRDRDIYRDRVRDDDRGDRSKSNDIDIREEHRERESRSDKERSNEKRERSRDKERERSSTTNSPQQSDRSSNERGKNGSGSSSVLSEKHTCIMMSGLPLNMQPRDLIGFFQGLRIAHGGIRLMREPRGTAYVEFCSTRDCEQAMLKNKQYIGVQVVTLRTCAKAELTEAVQKQHGIGEQQNSSNDSSKTSDEQHSENTNYNSNMQMRTANKDEPTKTDPASRRLPALSNVSLPNRLSDGSVKPTVASTSLKAPNLQQQNRATSQPNHLGQSSSMNNPSPPIQPQPRMPDIDQAVVGDLGLSGYVCFLHNLDPKITLEEICALFQNEQMIDDSVRMHYSSQTGEPTGDCLLAFITRQDAEKACTKINGKNHSGRCLQMWIVNQSV